MDGLKARLSFDAVAYDYDDEYLTIDTDTHTININNVSRLFGVQYDGNSKLIKFRIRNKLSDIQKMQDSIVYINWIDSKGVKGQSIAINKTINNDTCEFAWKVPFDALKNSGVLHFAMSAVMTKNSSSVIDQRWSTQIASVTTPDGIYIKSYTPSSEEEDRIAQIYNELSKMINKQNDNLQSQVSSLKEDLTDVKGVFPSKVNNNYCKNEVKQYGSTLYQPVYLEKGCIYKIAHIGSTEIGGATIKIVDYTSDIVYATIITTNYFYPNGNLARQNFAWDNDNGWYRLRFSISALFTDEQKETYKTGWIVAKIDDINSTKAITEFVPYGIKFDYTKVKLAEKLVEKRQDIACIGDSLTYGYGATVGSTDYPSVLQTLVTDKTVYNLGVSGEATDEILARQGGYPAVVNPFTIPADTTAVEITFSSSINIGANNTVLLRKGSNNLVNPVVIDGVEGNISASDNKYYFTRLEDGTAHEIKHPQYVITKEMREHKDDIQIIFMGTNGGWMITSDDAETRIKKLTSQIDMMIDYNTSKKYIIIGMHYFYSWVLYNGLTKEQLENAMLLKYGNHYINLRKYMIEYGLADAGLTATETDTEAINNGNVPPSLLYSDGIHGNAYFYNILANLVNKKGIELEYWN